MRLIKIGALAILLALTACVDPFFPETTKYDEVFFIEALIHNDTARSNEIRIFYSLPISSGANPFLGQPPAKVTGAKVHLIDTTGKQTEFAEKTRGIYTAPQGWIPDESSAYKLHVSYQDNIFESSMEQPKPSIGIDRVNHFAVKDQVGETGEILEGYQFTVNNVNPNDTVSYYRWETEATYRFKSAYEATHIWNRQTQVPASSSHVAYCFRSKNPVGIFTASTQGLQENRVQEAPLHFESQYGDALSIRYSLLVRQFNISEQAFDFWSALANQINQAGGLYETQPFRVKGNVFCTTDPKLMVSGVFELAGVSEKRIFVDRPAEFDIIPVVCPTDTIGTRDLPWWRIPGGSYILYDVNAQAYFWANQNCFDCTLKEGKLEKPDFWIDGE